MQRRAVVLFRATKGPNDPYDLAFKGSPYKHHFIQVLQFQYVNEAELRKSLLDSSGYSGIVFTSQTAVEAASAAMLGPEVNQAQLAQKWEGRPVFVVGKATSQAVASWLGLEVYGSCSGNAELLSQVVIEYFRCRAQPCPLLFPCSNLRRDSLPSALKQAGVGLEEVVSYCTRPHPDIGADISSLVADKMAAGDMVYAVFFSPSGVEHALEKLLERTKDRVTLKLVAIGPTSADALTSRGHTPSAVALKPTPDSLLEAISHIT